MAKKIQIEITCPDKNFYSGEADMLIVRTLEGDMAVMADHEPYVCPIAVGPFKIVDNKEKQIGAMAGGFLHVGDNKVTVISDSVEWDHEIETNRALAAKERAERRLQSKAADLDFKRAEYALKKAINRINVAKK